MKTLKLQKIIFLKNGDGQYNVIGNTKETLEFRHTDINLVNFVNDYIAKFIAINEVEKLLSANIGKSYASVDFIDTSYQEDYNQTFLTQFFFTLEEK